MTPSSFASWRKHMGLSQKATAEALGVSPRMVAYYEAGKRTDDGPKSIPLKGNGKTRTVLKCRPVEIPRSIELACAALALGIRSYSGPQ